MKKIVLIIVSAMLFVNCAKKLEFETKQYSKSSNTDCVLDYNCARIKLDIITSKGTSTISDSLNKNLFDKVKNVVYFGENPKGIKNYEELNQSFIIEFNKLKTEFPKDSLPSWEATAVTKIVYQTDKLLNIIIESYQFTGGAHGYESKQSLLFDPKTGKIIPYEKLFSNVEAITKIAEIAFRKQQKIDSKTPLQELGYQFENDVFVLPKNILFSKKGLTLHYNQYEAASYSQGPIEVELTFGEIEKYLTLK